MKTNSLPDLRLILARKEKLNPKILGQLREIYDLYIEYPIKGKKNKISLGFDFKYGILEIVNPLKRYEIEIYKIHPEDIKFIKQFKEEIKKGAL